MLKWQSYNQQWSAEAHQKKTLTDNADTDAAADDDDDDDDNEDDNYYYYAEQLTMSN